MNDYVIRTARLLLGLLLFSLGIFLILQANVGLSPWEAFNAGLADITGFSYGNIIILSGVAILFIDWWLKEKIGFGTILNTLLIGKFVDLIQYLDVIPMQHTLIPGVAMLLVGQVVLCIGSYYYIGSALGCGPRDALMVALVKRLPRVPVGVMRGAIEATVLLIGWLLGAKVGVGTVISVLGIGFILQYTFRAFRFDVKGVRHESVAQTLAALSSRTAV